jgi:large subunit ribosomal protein L21
VGAVSDAMSYAIVESGGKQYRVEKGTKVLVDRLPADEGGKVTLRAVAFMDNGDATVAGPDLEKVKVEATVVEHLRGPKLRVFKYRKKKGYRKRAGHRSELTRLEVIEVKKLTRKPAAKTTAETKPAADEAEGEKKPAAKKPAAKKPAAKAHGGEKKPAAKKPAAKKPAASKTATTKKDEDKD